jgi:hypothetical protein
VFQGGWGFHPCDYAALLAIKAFHKLVLGEMRVTLRSKHWEAKLPHNRVRRTKDGSQVPILQPECLGTDREYYGWVLAEYRRVRRPVATAAAVTPLDLPKKWTERFEELKALDAEKV